MGSEEVRSALLLKRIADVLGLPVERMLTGTVPDLPDGQIECLRLWHQLASEGQRRRALDALRAIADEAKP